MRFQHSDLELDCYLSTICRDDRCAIIETHPVHPIQETKRMQRARRRTLGWMQHPLEPMSIEDRRRESNEVLESCIEEVISCVIPKSSSMIRDDLRHIYGECEERRLYRCLRRMTCIKKIVSVDLSKYHGGGSLRGYLRPGSRLAADPQAIFELLNEHFESERNYRRKAA